MEHDDDLWRLGVNGELGDGEFQPDDPRDRVDHPPADSTCERIRRMLRDRADGDLVAGFTREVDEHVHSCRDCGLALSRAELEVIRLREALTDRELPAVPEGFVASVMARVEASLDDEDEDSAPTGFTERVMDRVRMEWSDPAPRSPLQRAFAGRRRYLAAAAIVMVALTTWFALPGESRVPPAQVTEVVDGWLVRGDERRRAVRGDALDEGSTLELGGSRDALGTVSLHEAAVDGMSVTRAVVNLDPRARVRWQDAQLMFALGGGRIEVREPIAVDVADVARVELASGEYFVHVRVARSFDDALFVERELRRVAVEVLDGEARIRRAVDGRRGHEASADGTLLSKGLIGHFDASSEVVVEAGARAPRFGAGDIGNPVAAGPDPREGTDGVVFEGRVVAAETGRPVGGALVRWTDLDGLRIERTTDASGHFALPSSVTSARRLVVEVTAPAGADLTGFGPEPVALRPGNRPGRQLLDDVLLAADVPVRGRVRTDDNRWVAGARVVPLVVDELFGRVEPLNAYARNTDADGRFELRGLPRSVGPHRVVALALEHPSYPTGAYLGLGRRDVAAVETELDVVLASGRSITVEGLEAGENVRVVQAVPGLPLGSMTDVFDGKADVAGRFVLANVGSGPLFVSRAGALRLTAMHVAAGGVAQTVTTAAGEASSSLVASAFGVAGPRAGRARVGRSGRRFDTVARVAAGVGSADLRSLQVHDRATRSSRPGTQLFLRRADGGIEFLGVFDGASALAFAEPGDGEAYEIFAIDDEGHVGVLGSDDMGGMLVPSVEMAAPAALQLDLSQPDAANAAGGDVLVSFRVLEGAQAGQTFWRLLRADHGWRVDGLVPGVYEVSVPSLGSAQCVLTPGGQVRIRPEPSGAGGGGDPANGRGTGAAGSGNGASGRGAR